MPLFRRICQALIRYLRRASAEPPQAPPDTGVSGPVSRDQRIYWNI